VSPTLLPVFPRLTPLFPPLNLDLDLSDYDRNYNLNPKRIQPWHIIIPSQSESEAVIKADTSSKKVDPKDLQGETVEHVKKVHGH
jgi:hypothetical protein